MRVGLDGTPLLGRRTGIGVYTERLVAALAERDADLVATAFTFRGRGDLRATVPPGVSVRSRPVPARLLREAWARAEFPPVEWLCGEVDVFHATNFVLPPTRRARGVVSVHDLSFLRYPDTVSAETLRYREFVPRSVRRARVTCVLTAAVADEVVDAYRVDPATIVVASPGVDESWFAAQPLEPSQRATLHLPERYIVAVGTLEPRKNLPRLVAAYRQLRAADPSVPGLVLVGPQGWGPALDLSTLPPGAVTLTGYLDTPTLQRVVAGASALAFPSRYEGFGIPPLEAFACGVPVVTSDLPVTREVLDDLATFVPSDDTDALAQGLADAIRAPVATDRLRAHAARWTWQRCADAVLHAYRLALS